MKLTGLPHWHRMVALVSLTVVAAAVVYTEARCSNCASLLYLVPGSWSIVHRRIERVVDGSGRGRVLCCSKCSVWQEVIEHGDLHVA